MGFGRGSKKHRKELADRNFESGRLHERQNMMDTLAESYEKGWRKGYDTGRSDAHAEVRIASNMKMAEE